MRTKLILAGGTEVIGLVRLEDVTCLTKAIENALIEAEHYCYGERMTAQLVNLHMENYLSTLASPDIERPDPA